MPKSGETEWPSNPLRPEEVTPELRSVTRPRQNPNQCLGFQGPPPEEQEWYICNEYNFLCHPF